MIRSLLLGWLTCLVALAFPGEGGAQGDPGLPAETREFFSRYCYECHDDLTAKSGLDLTRLEGPGREAEFATWVRIHDRVANGEMPPAKQKEQPSGSERSALFTILGEKLVAAETARRAESGRAVFRRLTRTEYENTVRDLLHLPGIAVADLLPEDGEEHGFDKVGTALDLSHVQLAKYLEAADFLLENAIATTPEAPEVFTERFYPAAQYTLKLGVLGGDAVLIKDGKPDPAVPLIGEKREQKLRWWEEQGIFPSESAVGVFRHEDDAFRPRFRFAPIYPGHYRIRASFWSFWWNHDHLEPSPKTESAALYAGSRVIDYFDAPSLAPTVHERELWMNPAEELGFNAASLHPIRVGEKQGRTLAYEGPGVAVDWVEVEGPIHDQWPPASHRALFGDLPLVAIDQREEQAFRLPKRIDLKTRRPIPGTRPDVPKPGNETRHLLWTVTPRESVAAEAERLLAAFLTRAFRAPVLADEVRRYVGIVEARTADGASFEEAMLAAYRTALCAPQFLFRRETVGELDDFALASRLSYFLWNSMPDATLIARAKAGTLSEPAVLRTETERLLADPKTERFLTDFLDQWLDLDRMEETTPDRKLYPEFSPFLGDAMVGETRAFFREMLTKNLGVSHLVDSDFALLNQALAEHYGIEGISGNAFRRVDLPDESHRGGFLTQASLLKITANGTTTSPVIRGAWVRKKLVGIPPTPPPPDIPAVEPDTRGTTTIREQLDAHRSQEVCASCHAQIDPPGFALESFDVIGGWRERYRSDGEGDKVDHTFPNGRGVGYRLGLPVDATGQLPDGRPFTDIEEFRNLLLGDRRQLVRNVVQQFLVYATGAGVSFSDRPEVERIVDEAMTSGDDDLRTLLDAVIASRLFREK